MPEYLAPGVYVEEVSSGIKPIEGVSTSTAGFLGRTERGPEGAKFITSFIDFQRVYGGFIGDENAYLAHAVKGFFDNGGARAFVSRVIGSTDKIAKTTDIGGFDISAIGPGSSGKNIYAILIPGTSVPAVGQRFRLLIAYYKKADFVNPLGKMGSDPANPNKRPSTPDILETFDNVTNISGSADDIVAVVNGRSQLITIKRNGSPFASKSQSEAEDLRTTWARLDDAGAAEAGVELSGNKRALTFLEEIDEISLMVAPDAVNDDDGFNADLITSCELLRDRVVLLSSKFADQKRDSIPAHKRDSSFAAFYHPWITVNNPIDSSRINIPAIGHIAGICARSDITRGVHKAPANEVVRGALDLPFPISKGLQDLLNPKGVNCIRDFTSDNRGIRLWGARTTSSDSEWKYLNVRRLFLFIEESIDQGTQWVVFEPNSDPTWAAVRRNVSNFLTSVWRSGALFGTTAEQAFFVRCDRTTMTEDDIQNGRLICVIGVAPVRPAEFVIFRISQKTLDTQA